LSRAAKFTPFRHSSSTCDRISRAAATAPVRERSAEDGHEAAAQKFVDDAVVPVDCLDHELEERFEIVNDLFGRALLGERGEVADVEEHDADPLLLAPNACLI
jgi:hypothetical protein